MRLTLNSVMHLLVDGVCAATLFRYCSAEPMFAVLVLLYNTLAFTTQCLVGLLTDRCSAYKWITAASASAVALGFLLPLPPLLRVISVGLGNSVFHVSGGTQTLLQAGDRAWPLGIFVAPGAVGLALGKLFLQAGVWLAIALLLCAVLSMLLRETVRKQMRARAREQNALPAAAVLLIAVAVRALGGTAAVFPWNTGAVMALLTAVLVCAGKMAGGFAMDRLGPVKSAVLSIVPAALLIAFCGGSMPLSLLGQFLLNLTMPVTLLLLYRLLPDSPGFAFGLAASALWPGTLAGQLFPMEGTVAVCCILLSFLAGLAAILWVVRKLRIPITEGGNS